MASIVYGKIWHIRLLLSFLKIKIKVTIRTLKVYDNLFSKFLLKKKNNLLSALEVTIKIKKIKK